MVSVTVPVAGYGEVTFDFSRSDTGLVRVGINSRDGAIRDYAYYEVGELRPFVQMFFDHYLADADYPELDNYEDESLRIYFFRSGGYGSQGVSLGDAHVYYRRKELAKVMVAAWNTTL